MSINLSLNGLHTRISSIEENTNDNALPSHLSSLGDGSNEIFNSTSCIAAIDSFIQNGTEPPIYGLPAFVFDLEPNTNTAFLAGEYCFTDFTLAAGHTIKCETGYLIIRCTGTATISGTIDANGTIISNFMGIIGNALSSPSLFNSIIMGGSGGGGGGSGILEYSYPENGSMCEIALSNIILGGESGETASHPTNVATSGEIGYSLNASHYKRILRMIPNGALVNAAEGGSGGGSDHEASGGIGGGMIMIIADTINFTGNINVSGQNGENGSPEAVASYFVGGGGGGGGGGGIVYLAAKNFAIDTGTINVMGGLGGIGATGTPFDLPPEYYNGANGGNGGAGFFVKQIL